MQVSIGSVDDLGIVESEIDCFVGNIMIRISSDQNSTINPTNIDLNERCFFFDLIKNVRITNDG